MATPFKLYFKQGSHTVTIEDFYDFEMLAKQPEVVLVENIPLTVTFESSDPLARFYMDGLDALPTKELKLDEESGDVYLNPSNQPVTLYENTNNYYPFIPGQYRLDVVAFDRKYYSWIRIRPKQVDRIAWKVMRDEVEATVTGLAQDYARQYKIEKADNLKGLPPYLSHAFFIIEHHYKAGITAINDLYRGANSKLQKEYQSKAKERSAAIDAVTISHRLRHPENTRTLKIPKNNINYDLQENCYLKHCVRFLIQTIAEYIRSAEFYLQASDKNKLAQIDQLKSKKGTVFYFINLAIKMRKALSHLHSLPWMNNVQEAVISDISPAIISDLRYRTVYRFYMELRQDRKGFNLDNLSQRQWKRTDKLYEIWGIIKLIKMISGPQLKFIPISGWIFDEAIDERMIIPDLPSGTCMEFVRGDWRIHLVYDEKIPRVSKHTDEFRQPLYITHGHNRPDARLDFYYKNVFVGSVIIDFKYRPQAYIWQKDQIEKGTRPKVMSQLIDYGNTCKSSYLFGKQTNFIVRDINPIIEVWALYPDLIRSGHMEQNSDYRLRLMELTPGKSEQHIIQMLQNTKEKIIERFTAFVNILE